MKPPRSTRRAYRVGWREDASPQANLFTSKRCRSPGAVSVWIAASKPGGLPNLAAWLRSSW